MKQDNDARIKEITSASVEWAFGKIRTKDPRVRRRVLRLVRDAVTSSLHAYRGLALLAAEPSSN